MPLPYRLNISAEVKQVLPAPAAMALHSINMRLPVVHIKPISVLVMLTGIIGAVGYNNNFVIS